MKILFEIEDAFRMSVETTIDEVILILDTLENYQGYKVFFQACNQLDTGPIDSGDWSGRYGWVYSLDDIALSGSCLTGSMPVESASRPRVCITKDDDSRWIDISGFMTEEV